jgi:hypothetical protein
MSVQNPFIDCICTQHSALSTQHFAINAALCDRIESNNCSYDNLTRLDINLVFNLKRKSLISLNKLIKNLEKSD